jgi:hypothetical protein
MSELAAEALAKRFWELRTLGEDLPPWDQLSEEERSAKVSSAATFLEGLLFLDGEVGQRWFVAVKDGRIDRDWPASAEGRQEPKERLFGDADSIVAVISQKEARARTAAEVERIRKALEDLDRYVVGTGSSGDHYQERTVGQMIVMNNENARGEKGQWIRRADALAAIEKEKGVG